MRPSMSTSYLWDLDPRAMVTCFAEHGWRTLELHDTHAGRLLQAGRPDDVGLRFRAFAADHGISFPQCHFYVAEWDDLGKNIGYRDITPADQRALDQVLDDVRRWLDFLNALEVEVGVLHIGGYGLKKLGWSAERVFARRVKVLSEIAMVAEGGSMLVCFENMEAPYGEATVAGMLRMISAVGRDDVGICLDTGHANTAGLSVPEFILQAGDKLKALHINDNMGHTDDHILPYGKGTTDWRGVVPALRTIGYDGSFNFEVPGENNCPRSVRELKLDYALQLAGLMIADSDDVDYSEGRV
jgi:sugar phosphate isomerase/epimerase